MNEGILYIRDFMTDRVASIDPEATIAEAVSRMEAEGTHDLPVMTNSTLKGWISQSSLARRSGVPSTTKVSHAMESPRKLQKDATVIDAAGLMVRDTIRALPVVNTKGQVVGILNRDHILEAALQIPSIAGLTVASVMNSELETAKENDRLDQALARLRDLHISQLLIIDDNGRLAGYVSLSDLLKAHQAEHSPGVRAGRGKRTTGATGASPSAKIELKGLVKDAPAVAPNIKLRDAIKVMRAQGTNFVVASEGGVPLGVVSRSNVLERIAALKPAEGVQCQIVGLDHEDYTPIYDMAQRSLKKISTEIRPDFLNLHYKVYKAKDNSGGDSKYSLSLHLGTEGRFFVQKADAWNALEATRMAFDGLEMRVADMKEMRMERRKGGSKRKARLYDAAPA